MFDRTLILGTAILIAATTAAPAAAQERGSIALGGFASWNSFDPDLRMDDAVGYGARVGAFLSPRWALEFEANSGTAKRPGVLADRDYLFIDSRLLWIPVKMGPLALLLGGGIQHVDANVDQSFTDQSYGAHALAGGTFALGENGALRVDYTRYFIGGVNHGSLKAGLVLYRHPAGKQTTVYRTAAAPPAMVHSDSVSAAETRRLRDSTAAYATLRDSLARTPATAPAATNPTNAAAVATMLEMVQFQRDQSTLDDVSRAILRDKVPIFNANPAMRIVITGFASAPGTDAYNMALGFRRATSAKEYLVSQGVAADRIEISTRGENNFLVAGPSDVANTANRRGQFRLLIADPYLVKP